MPVIAKEDISHDTILLRFGFPNPEWTIGMSVMHHLKIFSKVEEGKTPNAKPYSPVTPINQKGHIDFVIKCYPSLMTAIHRAKETGIQVVMIYTNKTRGDVLCKAELDAIANDPNCTNIKIVHTITREEGDLGAGFKKGRVNMDMLREVGWPEPADDMAVINCGPDAMHEANKKLLLEAGYTEEMIIF